MIIPLSDFVFLTFEKEKKTPKGVLLSDVSKSKPVKARVVAIGQGKLDKFGNFIKTSLKKGDIVLIDPFIPRQIKVEGEEYLVLKESEIFGKLN